MKDLFLITLATLYILPATPQRTPHFKTREEQLNEEYCSGLFKTSEGTIFDLVQENTSAAAYFNILDWLQGRVAGLQVYQAKNNIRIPFIRDEQATIYVDEVPVSPGYLNSLNSNDIAMIKIIKSPFLGGFNGSGGAIAIYTKDGDEENEVVKVK